MTPPLYMSYVIFDILSLHVIYIFDTFGLHVILIFDILNLRVIFIFDILDLHVIFLLHIMTHLRHWIKPGFGNVWKMSQEINVLI